MLYLSSFLGYKEYQVTISKVEGDARMYYLSTDRGDLTAAKLLGSSGKTDPLQGVNKCFFLIEDAAEEAEKKSPGLIRGIAFEDDWVEYKR